MNEKRINSPLLHRIPKKLGIPRRFFAGFWLATVASVVAILLAVGPGLFGQARYDPVVAVLTATLVALVWYTFFAYWAANREEPSFLRIDLEREGFTLIPVVENPSKRVVAASVHLQLWVDDKKLPASKFYSGKDSLRLTPLAKPFRGEVKIDDYIIEEGRDNYGDPIYESKLVKIVLRVDWSDDLGEEGEAGPKYYYFDVVAEYGAETFLESVVAEENIRRLFGQETTQSDAE